MENQNTRTEKSSGPYMSSHISSWTTNYDVAAYFAGSGTVVSTVVNPRQV